MVSMNKAKNNIKFFLREKNTTTSHKLVLCISIASHKPALHHKIFFSRCAFNYAAQLAQYNNKIKEDIKYSYISIFYELFLLY